MTFSVFDEDYYAGRTERYDRMCFDAVVTTDID